jgi:hypothetical protein
MAFPNSRRYQEHPQGLGFVVFTDLDVRNAFHEILLHWETSRMLSVQTPWVAPASGVLMHTMYEIFSDFLEWTIVIFDNILVLGVDEKDCYEKTMKVFTGFQEQSHEIFLLIPLHSHGRSNHLQFFLFSWFIFIIFAFPQPIFV